MSNASTESLVANSSIPASLNSTALSILVDPGPIYNSYTIGAFFIGLLITITSSILNAFGINLQKLDLNRRSSSAESNTRRNNLCFKPIWFLGLSLYILSQVLGSTLALQYMRSEYVAPLGSTSLIFNFLFARWLLGTKITTLDVTGTLVVILGVIGVIGFGNIRQAGIDEEANMSLSTLKALWLRPAWVIHLIVLEFGTGFAIWLAHIGYEVIQDKQSLKPRSGRRSHASVVEESEEEEDRVNLERALRRGGGRTSTKKNNYKSFFMHILNPVVKFKVKLRSWIKFSIEKWSASRPDPSLMKLNGLLWGTSAGLLAGQTLIFAKSYVKLIVNGFDHQGHGEPKDLVHPLSILILFFLLFTGIFQVWCLNKGLTVYDSTLIVPVLFATYTGSGFINSLIYLHELPNYRTGVLVMIWLCMGVLVIGVCMLSAKRVENSNGKKGGKNPNQNDVDTNDPLGEYSSSADPEGEVQATAIGDGTHESVSMMNMVDVTSPNKNLKFSSQKLPFESPLTHSINKLRNSRHSVFELEDNLPLGSNKKDHDNPFETNSIASSSSDSSSNSSIKNSFTNYDQHSTKFKSHMNPFEDFEILEAEQVPEDMEDNEDDEDEIDRLDHLQTHQQNHQLLQDQNQTHAYSRPPDDPQSNLHSRRNPS